jgi:hypothetical protein
VWVIILVAVILSLMAIMLATAIIDVMPDVAWILLILGAIGVFMSAYTLLGIRRRALRTKIEIPPVTTTIECRKCGFKNVREFQRGDYIFKEVEPCQKCNDKMLITAIYREVKEKEKELFRI